MKLSKKISGVSLYLVFSGGIPVLLSLITLTGWITGLHFLRSVKMNYVPMPPDTAISIIIIGILISTGVCYRRRPVYRIPVIISLIAVIVYGLLKISGYLIKTEFLPGDIFSSGKEMLGHIPLGRMSPYSGLLFLLSGTAVLLNILPKRRHLFRNIAGGLGLVVALAGFVASLGYLYGTPFLYSVDTIPLSERTSVSFFFLGLGIIFSGGENSIYLRHLSGQLPYARLLRVFVPFIVMLFLLQGLLDVIFTHLLSVNEAFVLALVTIFSVVMGIPVIIYISKVIFESAARAETERARLNEELRRVFAIQTLLLENNPLGICMVHNDLIRWANSRFCEIFWLENKTCENAGIDRLPEFRKIYEEVRSDKKGLGEGRVIDKAFKLQRSSGEYFWCRFIGSALKPEEPEGDSIWIIEDITERRLQREKMILLSHTIECLSECVSITDVANNVIYVNKAFEEVYGFNRNELTGKQISVISSDENDPMVVGSILGKTLSGKWEGEIINRKKSGISFPVRLSTSLVKDDNDEVLALVGVANDITERKEAENRLKKMTEDLKSSNDAKDKLFSIISHDLRSPFTTLLGYFELLTDQYNSFSDDEKRTMITGIKSSAENAFSLLDNLLTWSRSQMGKIVVNKSSFDLAEAAAGQIRILSGAADQKNIRLINSVAAGTMAFADREMIKTILLNLINNAIKFTFQGGEIKIYSSSSSDEVMITVEDNGVGMDPVRAANLFRTDSSVSTEGTSKEKGTGLGLIICNEFAVKNGGRIIVESEKGKGSRFTLCLRNE